MKEKQEVGLEKTQITVRLSKQTLDQLEKLAKKERRNRSNMIEFMLQKALAKTELV